VAAVCLDGISRRPGDGPGFDGRGKQRHTDGQCGDAGVYDIKIAAKEFQRARHLAARVNGASVGALQDEYQATDAVPISPAIWAIFNFAAAGNYSFKFTITGKNAASSGYSLCLDTLTLTPQ